MRVEIPISPNTKALYIEGLRDYPDLACRPHVDDSATLAVLELDLNDVYRCAVTRVVNKQTVSTSSSGGQEQVKLFYSLFSLKLSEIEDNYEVLN